MKIHLLDVGRTKYGDCIVVTCQDGKTIMVDGGHAADINLLQMQLNRIFGKRVGIKIDLLIVTHCHSDHIGCLPELIKLNIIDVEKALVADEKIGWGDTTSSADDKSAAAQDYLRNGLKVALQEEDATSMNDSELELFLSDAMLLRERYEEMLKNIGEENIVRYGRHQDQQVRELENEFALLGLKILGPDKEHLEICRQAISRASDSFDQYMTDSISEDKVRENPVEIYRSLMKKVQADNIDFADSFNTGAAKNNQSIVISLESDGWKALLTGDMQLAKSQVKGLDLKMDALLKLINSQGPYDFIKIPHHCASNGINETLLQEWNKNTVLFAHTGGWDDPGHPDGGVLRILEKYKNNLFFARTDRNGLIVVEKDKDGVGFFLSKGNENDFTKNEKVDETEFVSAYTAINEEPNLTGNSYEVSPVQTERSNFEEQFVEVVTRVPHSDTRVTITIDVDTRKKKVNDEPALARGRFSGLLFVTSWSRLSQSIKDSGSKIREILGSFEGIQILDIPNPMSSEYCSKEVRRITQNAAIRGVVILGGYNVIPAQQIDVLDKMLRQKVINEGMGNRDADDFVVWSDDIYGDNDNDMLPELPVSRIPDGGSLDLILACLNSPKFTPATRFGVRNLARPFANTVFEDIPGGKSLIEVSEKFGPSNVTSHSGCGSFYYMLHGAHWDCTRFWGETPEAEFVEAFNIKNVPVSAPGSIIFTGCCWGALTVSPAAYKFTSQGQVTQFTPEQSIALSYLKAGALGFVGCTGTHYSPSDPPYNYFGKPLHDKFWTAVNSGLGPAEALFKAKTEYAKAIPHGLKGSYNYAIELKIMNEFTCLGLGW